VTVARALSPLRGVAVLGLVVGCVVAGVPLFIGESFAGQTYYALAWVVAVGLVTWEVSGLWLR